jgi:hypothetical protein
LRVAGCESEVPFDLDTGSILLRMFTARIERLTRNS